MVRKSKGVRRVKKLISIGLVLVLAVSFVGCNGAASSSAASSAPVSSIVSSSVSASAANSDSELQEARDTLEALGDIKVEKNAENIKITLPAQFIGKQTQEELDQMAAMRGMQSITLNQDGSATYVMNESQHKEFLKQTADSINQSLKGMFPAQDMPNIISAEANADFTHFTVTTTSTEVSMDESLIAMPLYIFGGMYAIFNGTVDDSSFNIQVDFVNADTGAILQTANSKDMESE